MSGAPGAKPTISDAPPMRVLTAHPGSSLALSPISGGAADRIWGPAIDWANSASFTFEILELRCKALADFLGGWPTPSWRGQVKGHRRSGRSRRKAP